MSVVGSWVSFLCPPGSQYSTENNSVTCRSRTQRNLIRRPSPSLIPGPAQGGPIRVEYGVKLDCIWVELPNSTVHMNWRVLWTTGGAPGACVL
eukprot:4211213-Pyramimonas_sp.AAC.1